MKSQDKLRKFSDLIAGIVPNVYHYERAKKSFPCAVWKEDDMELFRANNRAAEIVISGTLDYFTQEEFDPVIDAILEGLTAACVNWSVESTQYEEETGLIHTEIGWRY